MKTSIIIPAYKAATFIEECLDSIFIQSHIHEVLLAVDGCPETMEEIIQIRSKYDARLQVFYSENNLCPFPQINQMIKRATGDYIIPFGADDIMRPNMMNILYKQKGNADLLRFKCLNFGDVEDSRIGRTYHPGGPKLYRRGIFNVFGGFPKPYLSAESDLQYRMDKFRNIIRIEVSQSVLFDRRIHENNLTRTIPHHTRNLDYKNKQYPSILDAYFEIEDVEYSNYVKT